MKNLIKFLCINFLFLNSCCSKYSSEIERETAELMNRHIKYCEKYGFRAYGTGAFMPEKLNRFHIDYELYTKSDIETARELLVAIAQILINSANENESFRKHMAEYPFTAKNIEMGIQFVDSNHDYQPPPYLAFVMTTGGKIFYYTYDPIEKELQEIHSEIFENTLE